jgi:chromate reductase
MTRPRQVIAFAASSSRRSINKQLVSYAASLLKAAEVEILDLNDFELPLFSVDREEQLGQPELAKKFYSKIGYCDGILISLAEHNGNYSAAFKNLFDWVSRIDPGLFQNKPMVLLATSPGARGGRGVLDIALDSIPRFKGEIKASLSLPAFADYFDSEKAEVVDDDVREQLSQVVNKLFD